MSLRGCFNGERVYASGEIKSALGEGGANVWYREGYVDVDAGAIDEMVVRLEADLTRSLLASNGCSGQDGLNGEWVWVLRAVDDCDEEDEWVYGEVLCVSGDDVYEMKHDTGEVSIRVRVELDGVVVHENDALGRTTVSQSVFFQSQCSFSSYS